ncbi:alpha-tocopherol transfer protein isoform X1 [Bactrocera neohumeralis]|uniref:alpha-tocopherol transfer protein isoform X1 n=2 Tax=Bactrocera neohumeralis TaxID=98809 RepID=UPI00216640E5|nr:alpha-tocopherol transfer protein isoform X1 [Bactrocera neohumeralis]
MVGQQLNKKLDELEQWFKENPKLPQEIDRILLRRFLKCMYNNVEETKKIIELNFSIRNKNQHIFLHRDPDDEAVKAIRDVVEMVPLPGLTPEGYKLLLFRLSDIDPKKLNSVIECKAFFMLADCRYSELDIEKPQTQKTEKSKDDSQTEETSEIEDDSLQDDSISNGEVQICDIGDYTLSHMARISFTTLRMYMNFLQEAYPVRLRAMHIINCPPFLNKMVSIVKPFIHEDVFKMIHFHTEGMDSLYEKVPRHMLPNEYGGNAGDITDLKKIWTDKLKVKRDYLMDERHWKMDPAQNSRRWYLF